MKRPYNIVKPEEVDFIKNLIINGVVVKPGQVMEKIVYTKYTKAFPDSTRSFDSVKTIYYKLKRAIRSGVNLTISSKPKIQVAPAVSEVVRENSVLQKLEFSPVMADNIDNILIDLIDEIQRLREENTLLRKDKLQ